MLRKSVFAMLALICVPQTAISQDVNVKPNHRAAAVARNEALDASMAQIAVKAALQPKAEPTQQDLLNVILIMSLRGQRPSGT